MSFQHSLHIMNKRSPSISYNLSMSFSTEHYNVVLQILHSTVSHHITSSHDSQDQSNRCKRWDENRIDSAKDPLQLPRLTAVTQTRSSSHRERANLHWFPSLPLQPRLPLEKMQKRGVPCARFTVSALSGILLRGSVDIHLQDDSPTIRSSNTRRSYSHLCGRVLGDS